MYVGLLRVPPSLANARMNLNSRSELSQSLFISGNLIENIVLRVLRAFKYLQKYFYVMGGLARRQTRDHEIF